MSAEISLVVSILSLAISGLTAWLTLLQRGTVRMTQPSMIVFASDGGSGHRQRKVYLRTLLYSTSQRGRIIEGMYVRLRRGDTTQNLNFWVHGDQRLSRGSGLFIPETGVDTNHHFVVPADGTVFQFLPGHYSLEVFASLVGERIPRRLYAIQLEVNSEQALLLKDEDQGLHFDWSPDAGKYHSHTLTHQKNKLELLDILRDSKP